MLFPYGKICVLSGVTWKIAKMSTVVLAHPSGMIGGLVIHSG